MKYSDRGRHNPFDAYMAGIAMWLTPRQIILLDDRLAGYTPADPVDAAAYADMQETVAHEAGVKRKKYLGGQNDPC